MELVLIYRKEHFNFWNYFTGNATSHTDYHVYYNRWVKQYFIYQGLFEFERDHCVGKYKDIGPAINDLLRIGGVLKYTKLSHLWNK